MLCGVLALQGAFNAHYRMLQQLEVQLRLVRQVQDLEGLDAIVLPGGESTTMLRLLRSSGLYHPLAKQLKKLAVFATCAGTILLAKKLVNYPHQEHFSLLDISVERNGFGRQINSRCVQLDVPLLEGKPLPAFFIRAPRVQQLGREVVSLASYQDETVLLRQGRILATTFHTELSDDLRLHRYFIEKIAIEQIARKI